MEKPSQYRGSVVSVSFASLLFFKFLICTLFYKCCSVLQLVAIAVLAVVALWTVFVHFSLNVLFAMRLLAMTSINVVKEVTAMFAAVNSSACLVVCA